MLSAVVRSPPSRGRGLKQVEDLDRALVAVSPPSRGRGLKHQRSGPRVCWHRVAPFTGARIETASPRAAAPAGQSPPSRGRGLKLGEGHVVHLLVESPPSRGRGLKPGNLVDLGDLAQVAPFTGARIETPRAGDAGQGGGSPPSRGRGLKH